MIDSIFKNANILIVDDQEANIDILAGLLEIQGYSHVKSTTDPRQVAGLLDTFAPDLILLDLMMPHMSGYEVMNQLRELIPYNTYLPILVLTADITIEAKQRALSDGARDFLSKPFDLIEVGLRIENLLFARSLHQQSLKQNILLEEKVRERTLALEISNQELIHARDMAEAADRLKTAFIKNISHEIRTPLNGILGMYQVLTDADLSLEEKEEYFKHLQTSSDRLIKTITDYLDIAMLVSGNMVKQENMFDPSAMVYEVCSKYTNAFKSKNLVLTIQDSPAADHFNIVTDLNLVSKSLSHLVDNALKFTRKGFVSIGYAHHDGEVEFFVKDTGSGIDRSAYDSIYNLFMQENVSDSRGYEGNGLGLTIAKRIIELLGGNIRFESVKGEGSTFYFTIPCRVAAGEKR
ncbi:MAG: response regulator [Bacteroidota bacterium]